MIYLNELLPCGIKILIFILCVTASIANLELLSDLFEGDMKITCEYVALRYGYEAATTASEKELCIEDNSGNSTKSAGDPTSQFFLADFLWDRRENGKLIVPYKIQHGQFIKTFEYHIRKQLDFIEDQTGVVKFVQRTHESSFISVINGKGCWAFVGKLGKENQPQGLSLNSIGCNRPGTIQHEFLHALGIIHEHSRTDRDRHIQIIWKNIITERQVHFGTSTNSQNLGIPYDYNSVMHYSPYAFTKNGKKTIKMDSNTKDVTMGQRIGMSPIDIIKVRLLYQCNSGPRHFEDYISHPCRGMDCPCWEGATGCDGDDDACQGDLVCLENVCGRRSAAPTLMPSLVPTNSPTLRLTTIPTIVPSLEVSSNTPSAVPTLMPSLVPTNSPMMRLTTTIPTMVPSLEISLNTSSISDKPTK